MSKLVIPRVSPSESDPAPHPQEDLDESSSSSSSSDELGPQSGVVTGDSDARAGDTTFELPARESLRHLTKRQRRRAMERAIARQRLAALEAAPNAVEVPLLQPRYGRERRLHRSMRVTTEGSSVAHANASEMMRGADQPATAERLVVTMGDTSFASNVTFDQPYALYRHGKRRVYAHSLGYGADGDLIVERSEVAALTSDGFTSDSNARSLLRQLRGASATGSRGARQPRKGGDTLEEAFSTDEVEAAKRVQLRRVQTTVSSAVCVNPGAAVPVDRFQPTSVLAAQARGTGLFGAAREAVSDAEACPRTAGMDRNLWRRKYPGVPCPKNRKVRNRLMNDFFVSEHTRPLVEAAREQRTTRSSSRKRSSSIPAALYDAPPPEHYDNDVCSSMTGGDFFPRGFPNAFRKLVHRDEDDQHAAIHQMIRDADEASPPSAQRRPGSAKKRSAATSASLSGVPSASATPKLGPVSAGTAYRLATLPAGDGGEALKVVQRTKAQAQLADPSSLSVARFQTLPLRLRAELQHAMDATEFMPQFIRDVETRVREFVVAHAASTASTTQKRKGKSAVLSPVSSPTTSSATMTPVTALPAAVGAVAMPSAASTFPRSDSSPMQVETTGVPERTPVTGPAAPPAKPATTLDVHCRDGYGRLIVHGISRFYGLVSKSEDVSEPQLPPSSESRGRPTTRGIHGSSAVAAPPPVLWGRVTRIALPANGRVPPIPAVTLAELLTGRLDMQQKPATIVQSVETSVEPVKAPAKVTTSPAEEESNTAAPKRFRKKRTLDSRRRVLPLFF